MAKTLPRAEGSEDIRINVSGGVGNEDLVGRSLAPGDELIEEVVRRNTPVMDALFRGFVGHRQSLQRSQYHAAHKAESPALAVVFASLRPSTSVASERLRSAARTSTPLGRSTAVADLCP